MSKDRLLFLADTHVQANPTAEQLAEMTSLACAEVSNFGIKPRVALLSHSNFRFLQNRPERQDAGSPPHHHQCCTDIAVEGEMQADTALNMEVMSRIFPASQLDAPANVLIFPDVDSANISFNLMRMVAPMRRLHRPHHAGYGSTDPHPVHRCSGTPRP